MQTKSDWRSQAANSLYQTAILVQQLLQQGNYAEAQSGIDALIEAMGRSEKRALRSQLIRLMVHVIKWQCQPGKRSSSWVVSILSARREIVDIQAEVPSLNQSFIESIWDKSFDAALKEAEAEMGFKCQLTKLSGQQIFEDEYSLL
ncbi:protein of unknown function DUF29 [Thalassoporum mexicanum PCC 7367]|uniref:DUF29 domain-containing protein n=1 Tax=Thalassoporum mexicanum TaxID=3457544 RepID=UPI0002A000EA|nr:DUF29 domain-containing protein [Pseudanabaena sp. PCC 7367]AFY69480.1 protein of unknown function DUF29 [Pseudanabaena sp. PCC 7367]